MNEIKCTGDNGDKQKNKRECLLGGGPDMLRQGEGGTKFQLGVGSRSFNQAEMTADQCSWCTAACLAAAKCIKNHQI